MANNSHPYPDDSSQKLLYKIALLLGGDGGSGGSGSAEQSVSTPISSSTTALAARSGRISGFIQNLGTNKLYVKEGPDASSTNFSAILVGGSVQDDGFGGVHNLGSYTGVVTVAGTSPRYVATERY